MAAFVEWVRKHPFGHVLDIGSSIGIFSAAALFTGEGVSVVAFDSDLNSLAAVRRLCQYAPKERLQVVWGFLGSKESVAQPLDAAVSETEQALKDRAPTGDVGTTQYICFDSCNDGAIPCRKLDDLLQGAERDSRPLLIKCDVEGAELLVLLGAERVLRGTNISILLSVHPPLLPAYGQSVQDVRAYLEHEGYTITILGVDHEEHWWCEKPHQISKYECTD
jgi:FkbM family methyltransferase